MAVLILAVFTFFASFSSHSLRIFFNEQAALNLAIKLPNFLSITVCIEVTMVLKWVCVCLFLKLLSGNILLITCVFVDVQESALRSVSSIHEESPPTGRSEVPTPRSFTPTLANSSGTTV